MFILHYAPSVCSLTASAPIRKKLLRFPWTHTRSLANVRRTDANGGDDAFERVIAEFGVAYADLAEADYAAFKSVVS